MSVTSKRGRAAAASVSKPQLQLVASAPSSLPAGVPQFLTIDEVATMLRCRPSTIYQLVHKRKIPYRKRGRQLLFEAGEIDQWTKDCADRD
jgi:excisionase family DNA binding protein